MKRDLPELFAVDRARSDEDYVAILAALISKTMERLHGGEWAVDIGHDSEFVCISRHSPLSHN